MSTAHDAALAFLIAQHVEESAQAFRQQESVVVKVTMSPAPSKKVTAKKEAAPIHHQGTPMVGMMLPDRGSLNAKDFLLAMRNAGKRTSETGASFIDQREKRNDEIRAIHGFMYEIRKGVKVAIGYDPKRDFGSQEQAARMLAQREIRGPVKVSEVVKPSLSAAGYVAGMPDLRSRRMANLEGQEVVYAELMIQHDKDAADPTRTAEQRKLSAGLADLERERLADIRKQIAALL